MVIVLVVAFFIFFLIRFETHKNVMRALVDAAVVFAVLTVFFAEILSLFNAYRAGIVFTLWLIVCGACIAVFRSKIINAINLPPFVDFHIFPTGNESKNGKSRKRQKKQFWQIWKTRIKGIFKFEFENIAILTIIVFCGISFFAAVFHPSMNYDSHVFHLPRVFFWMQNGSVHHFPTSVPRQLFHDPFSAIAMLQTLVLSHGFDWLLNLSQWFSYVGAIILAALISVELGLSKRWQLVSALLVMSTPMAILQSVTTQNDLQGAFWMMAAVYYTLRLVNTSDEESWNGTGVFLGFALGIAALVKLNAAGAVLPFSLLVILFKLRKKNILKLFGASAIIVICIASINLGHYARSFVAHDFDMDAVVASSPGLRITRRAAPAINYLTVQVVMNITYNFGNPSSGVSSWIDERVAQFSSAMGVEFNAGRIRISGNYFETYSPVPCHNQGSSPVQSIMFWFLVLSFPVLFVVMRIRKENVSMLHVVYLLACVASFVLLAANQRFLESMNRYLLPSLLASMPIVSASLMMMERARLFVLSVPLLAVTVLFGAIAASWHTLQPRDFQTGIQLGFEAWLAILFILALATLISYARKSVLKYSSAITVAMVIFVVLYGTMPFAGRTGHEPLHKARTVIEARSVRQYEVWRTNVIHGMLLSTEIRMFYTDLNFLDRTMIYIEELNIRYVGMHYGRQLASYPILHRFINSGIYVKNINATLFGHREDFTLVPQAIYSIRNYDDVSDIFYSGVRFVEVDYTPTRVGARQDSPRTKYSFLVSEALLGNHPSLVPSEEDEPEHE